MEFTLKKYNRTPEIPEVKVKKIVVVVREHLDNEEVFGNLLGQPVGSTVGVKLLIGDDWKGTYIPLPQQELSVSDVVDIINKQFEQVLEEARRDGRS